MAQERKMQQFVAIASPLFCLKNTKIEVEPTNLYNPRLYY
ncbi:hypothetical protein yberc0001_10250 [Yersinia bercovieri ATCC 43970]|uniref:Uncharacterized protein n=1 Tax=Yersinia bercovieri ATCC 43970 TaxID=349968 RepID=A0ABP2E787_YERBE|nr:hypothetical protein yberc0001_10250 [Yersinia bercovieri ATCC 43970]